MMAAYAMDVLHGAYKRLQELGESRVTLDPLAEAIMAFSRLTGSSSVPQELAVTASPRVSFWVLRKTEDGSPYRIAPAATGEEAKMHVFSNKARAEAYRDSLTHGTAKTLEISEVK